MKLYRYIKVNSDMLWGENEIDKDMLACVKQGFYDTIIDLHTMTQYDPEDNVWKEIKGTSEEFTNKSTPTN